MLTADLDVMYKKKEDVRYEKVDDVYIILSDKGEIDLEESFVLTESAGLIFELSDGKHKIRDICRVLCNTYDAPEDEILNDLITCLDELVQDSLVSVIK